MNVDEVTDETWLDQHGNALLDPDAMRWVARYWGAFLANGPESERDARMRVYGEVIQLVRDGKLDTSSRDKATNHVRWRVKNRIKDDRKSVRRAMVRARRSIEIQAPTSRADHEFHAVLVPHAIVGPESRTERLVETSGWKRSKHYGLLCAAYVERLHPGQLEELDDERLAEWAEWLLGRVAGWLEVAVKKTRKHELGVLLPSLLDAVRPAASGRTRHTYTVACFDFVAACMQRDSAWSPQATSTLVSGLVRWCLQQRHPTWLDHDFFERLRVPKGRPPPALPPIKEPPMSDRDRDWSGPLSKERVGELKRELDAHPRKQLATPWLTGRVEVLSRYLHGARPSTEIDGDALVKYLSSEVANRICSMVEGRTRAHSLLAVAGGVLRGDLPVPAELADAAEIEVQIVPPIGVRAEDVFLCLPVVWIDGAAFVRVELPVQHVPDGFVDASVRLRAALAYAPEKSVVANLHDVLEPFPARMDEWNGITIGEERIATRVRRWLSALLGRDAVVVVDDHFAVGLGAGSDAASGILELETGATVHFEVRNGDDLECRIAAWDLGERGVSKLPDATIAAGATLSWPISAGDPGDHVVVIAVGDDAALREISEALIGLDRRSFPEVARLLDAADARAWRYRAAAR